MDKTFFAIATNEIRILIREKTFLLLLLVFLLMTLFSTYIGWSTKITIIHVYQDSLVILKQSGVTHLPPNPFLTIPALAIFKNMIIYIFLIGSLLAIVIGHRSFMMERKSKVTLLLFSKPVDRRIFILGKIMGIACTLLLIILSTCIISFFSTLIIPNQYITITEALKLLSFYSVSFLYILIFALLGLTFAIVLPTESLAMIVPIIIWIVVTFIFPELITGQNPVALLNPVNIVQATDQGAFFSTMRKLLFPFSIEQHYTGISQTLLGVQPQYNGENAYLFLYLLFYFAVALIVCLYALHTYSASKDTIYE